jgi:hypothetical protein
MVVGRHHAPDSSMSAVQAKIRLPFPDRSATPQDKDGRVDPWWRQEGATRDRAARAQLPATPPAPRSAGGPARIPPHDGALQHHVGGYEPGSGREQHPEQRTRDRVRRACDHPERPSRQPQRRGIRLDDCNARPAHTGPGSARPALQTLARVAPPQVRGPARMGLDGDDMRSGPEQMAGESSLARTDIKNELSRPDARVRDDQGRPLIS